MPPGGHTPAAGLESSRDRRSPLPGAPQQPGGTGSGRAGPLAHGSLAKPTIKEGNEKHLLNLCFNNPALHRCLLLRHHYYYTPGSIIFLFLCEFSALCFSYKCLKLKLK